jgi:predicted TPR repeat methyltransferase
MATGPLFVSSGDAIADRRYKFALDYAAGGDFAAAVDVLMQTVELAPAFATAWFALAAMRERLGDRNGAIAAFERARDTDPDDYHGARLHLDRLGASGTTPEMTAVYVQRLFDQHAADFDKSLRERLHYRGPELLLEAVRQACTAIQRPARFDAMLDLGCGTGLVGLPFRPIVRELVGVDLSAGMIAEAEKKACYDRLEVGELNRFLVAETSAHRRYDLVIAADVLVYMADLPGAAAKVRDVLSPGGLFALTVETHAGEGMVLGPTLRYAHAPAYVDGVLAQTGFKPLVRDATSLRREKDLAVSSLVIVACHNEPVASPG